MILDDFSGLVPIQELLRVLDGWTQRLQIKGGHTWALWDKVIITTNVPADQWYPDAHPEHKAALARRLATGGTTNFDRQDNGGLANPHIGHSAFYWDGQVDGSEL